MELEEALSLLKKRKLSQSQTQTAPNTPNTPNTQNPENTQNVSLPHLSMTQISTQAPVVLLSEKLERERRNYPPHSLLTIPEIKASSELKVSGVLVVSVAQAMLGDLPSQVLLSDGPNQIFCSIHPSIYTEHRIDKETILTIDSPTVWRSHINPKYLPSLNLILENILKAI
ncbi:hypothetical protein NEDG_00765 [Nematocida displodere]|uniref:Uncharacterized protein n=1 Tax=Nematocida displodere TaxID=1805483 RepID=A0A177EER7_9MICR|nr:hypothetical protein NEDG_00765 [Nematocida displodere]